MAKRGIICAALAAAALAALASCERQEQAQQERAGALAREHDPEAYFAAVPVGGGAEARIARYHGASLDMAVPLTLGGLPVSEIGPGAFSRRGLVSVEIHGGIVSIGSDAFSGNDLESVAIPGSVASIGSDAFSGNRLASVEIGSGVAEIGDWAFQNNLLTGLYIPGSVARIGMGAFLNNEIVGVQMPAGVDVAGADSMGVHGASFAAFYEANGRQAGFYAFANGQWSFAP